MLFLTGIYLDNFRYPAPVPQVKKLRNGRCLVPINKMHLNFSHVWIHICSHRPYVEFPAAQLIQESRKCFESTTPDISEKSMWTAATREFLHLDWLLIFSACLVTV